MGSYRDKATCVVTVGCVPSGIQRMGHTEQDFLCFNKTIAQKELRETIVNSTNLRRQHLSDLALDVFQV